MRQITEPKPPDCRKLQSLRHPDLQSLKLFISEVQVSPDKQFIRMFVRIHMHDSFHTAKISASLS